MTADTGSTNAVDGVSNLMPSPRDVVDGAAV
jgi:hypothetical protein